MRIISGLLPLSSIVTYFILPTIDTTTFYSITTCPIKLTFIILKWLIRYPLIAPGACGCSYLVLHRQSEAYLMERRKGGLQMEWFPMHKEQPSLARSLFPAALDYYMSLST